MLVEKEVIRPGQYWYTDEATGLPRKLDVTPELTRYWHDQGSAMLSAGLTVPIPCEHDFTAHPMTPRDKLLNNAGEVREYRLRGDTLFAACDIQDADVRKKLGGTIRWTSPWINSFTDGQGKRWDNVISHLALTTRPRITKQQPFNSVAAALSMATVVGKVVGVPAPEGGYCLSRAGRLFVGKRTRRLRPRYPVAFSMLAGGVALGDDMPFAKKKKGKPGEPPDDEGADEFGGDLPDEEAAEAGEGGEPGDGLADPLADASGDIAMEELLCDLLQALGVPMPDESNESEFKRHLYEAAMSKIKELTSKGMGDKEKEKMPDQNQPPGANPHTSQPNPLVQQEQQPMYMSLDDINKLPDPMRGVALAMYNENAKLRAEMEASKKVTDSLRDAKLREAGAARATRINLLGRLSPKMKTDLDAMVAMPGMALSMGDGGAVVDPMAQTLALLEKGLADMPRLLTTEASALSVQPHPTDGEMSAERADELAENMGRMMGAPATKRAAS